MPLSIDMVGDVVGGYVIKESLGSGRVGLLYLAFHPQTGHRAVVRRRLNDADPPEEFGAEAAQLLGLRSPPRVERRTSRSGIKLLLAIIDEAAPGSGRTEHVNTQLLPSGPRPRQWPRALVLVAFLILGVAVGGWCVGSEAAPIDPAPAQVLKVEAPRAAQPEVVALAPSVVPSKQVSRPRAARCQPDATWKRNANGDLAELMNRAAPYEELTRWTSAEYEAIAIGIAGAVTPAQCSALEARLHTFYSRVLAAEKP